MMFGVPNIIVVDDNPEELEDIKRSFYEAGMPCLPIQYVNDDPDNVSGIDHISLSDSIAPRVVVTDLNLTESLSSKATSLVAPLAEVLKQLPIKGPYILCVWSKLADIVDEVITLLEERYKEDLLLPIHYSVIPKHEFSKNPKALRNRVEEVVSENDLFNALLSWEYRVAEAARNTTNTLYDLARSIENGSIDASSNRLKNILAAIGNESIGVKNAIDMPALAMESGLTPILEDQLTTTSEVNLDEKWSKAIPSLGKSEELDTNAKAKLNSFYHIEEVINDYPKAHRGVFVKFNNEYLGAEESSKKFERSLGRSLKSLLHEEFLNPRYGSKTERQVAREQLELGFLEVSAACDHAQRKTKLPKYILGALIPVEFENFTIFQNGNKDRAHEGIYRLPVIELGGKSYIVKFSFKYQFGVQPDHNKWFGECMFRVRDQVLSSIIFNKSQHASRPGIISFG
ncbi:hypothetical protein ACJJJB_20015 [Microbulbifer sp. ANSA001]|uniref:hypothetical protein n=1 Tax=Microbulbifer sp. ANSA001 TaxID=3243358 RepID=UPI0040414EA7